MCYLNQQVTCILEIYIYILYNVFHEILVHTYPHINLFMYTEYIYIWNFYSKNNFKILTCWLR